MNLFKANHQWSKRPADERFNTIQELRDTCKAYADISSIASVPYENLRTETVDGEVKLTGTNSLYATLTHWSFGQLSRLVGAPADYLRELPATLAAQNLNYGLKNRINNKREAQLLFHENGGLILRAITSDMYTQIWNYEIADRLLELEKLGWQVPPARPTLLTQYSRPATQTDVLRANNSSIAIHVGDPIAPAGLYASDHDMFAFLVNESNRINDGSAGGLGRGFFVENSEVGAGAFKICTFLYRFICGNHIVWDAQNVTEISIKHVGNADDRAWHNLALKVNKYTNSTASQLEAKIAQAKTYQISAKKEDVLDRLFGLKIATRRLLETAYTVAEQNESADGSPYSAWGFAQGMTRLSQETLYADERTKIDRAAGKVLELSN